MDQTTRPIGILDSGIGGFSVARQVQRLLPQEELLYFGDGAHVPYGNHSAATIAALARYMLRFMRRRRVKALLVACNTISCVLEECRDALFCPTFNTVQAGAEAACRTRAETVGVISTVFTHQSGCYPRKIGQLCPGQRVVSRGLPRLAQLVEHGLGDAAGMAAIEAELRRELEPLVQAGAQCCVLGCTHYPLVEESIRRLYPRLELIDPAREMARRLAEYLAGSGLGREAGHRGGVEIHTTGSPEEYALRARQAGLETVRAVLSHPPMSLPRP